MQEAWKIMCPKCGKIIKDDFKFCIYCGAKLNQDTFDQLMTGQLVALYRKAHDKNYLNEYLRRLKSIGFSEEEANNLFMFESMILKYEHREPLCDKNYLKKCYFNLKTPILNETNDYYIQHQYFLCSEITKIWDEAEANCLWTI